MRISMFFVWSALFLGTVAIGFYGPGLYGLTPQEMLAASESRTQGSYGSTAQRSKRSFVETNSFPRVSLSSQLLYETMREEDAIRFWVRETECLLSRGAESWCEAVESVSAR